MIKEAIAKVVKGENLEEKEAVQVMEEIMSGKCTDAQIGAFITALRIKGETVEEITGCAKVMRAKATKINVLPKVDIDRDEVNIDWETVVDTCGTGGTGTNTFNISTTTAFVVAGCGVRVAKHGNRGVSSGCGSADVIKGLGVNLDVPPEVVAKCLREIGIGFLYAPLFHGAMKYAIGPRREIGLRTVFNILGPLTNPAGATAQVLGVYDGELTEMMANVLNNLGVKRAFVVHGLDTLDEITITGPTKVSELKKKKVETYHIRPEDFGLPVAHPSEIKGGGVEENVEIVYSILKGKKGAQRNVVLLNASAALVAGGKAKDFKEGIRLAEDSIDSGRAMKKLELLKEYTTKAA